MWWAMSGGWWMTQMFIFFVASDRCWPMRKLLLQLEGMTMDAEYHWCLH